MPTWCVCIMESDMLCLLLDALFLPGTPVLEGKSISGSRNGKHTAVPPLSACGRHYQSITAHFSINHACRHYQLMAAQAYKVGKIFCLYWVKKDTLRRALECHHHHHILFQKLLQCSKSHLSKRLEEKREKALFSTQQLGLKMSL